MIRVENTPVPLVERLSRSVRNGVQDTTTQWIRITAPTAEQRWTDNERRMIMGEVKNYPPYLDYPKPYKPQTNADRIRSMSDDELNDLFYEIYNAGVEDASSYEWGQRTNNFEWTMDWLQMPTKTQKEG